MNRVSKGIKNLCQSLSKATAACQRFAGMVPALSGVDTCQVSPKAARTESSIVFEALAALNRMAQTSACTIKPVPVEKGFDVFISKLKDQKAGLSCPGVHSPLYMREKGRRPGKQGLEILRITLNLARGDLENGSSLALRSLPVS